MEQDAILIIASSESDANMFYASGFTAPDPFVFLQLRNKKKILMMNDLEFERAKIESSVDEVLPETRYHKAAKKRGVKNPGLIDEIHEILFRFKIKTILVPANFPVAHADSLRKRKYRLRVKKEPFFEERLIKTQKEITLIKKALKHTEDAFGAALEEIKKAKVRRNILYRGKTPLTSEDIKRLIDVELMKNQYVAQHTIVACGDDGCNPHSEGSGVLRANRSIIIDIFPRSIGSGYFGDFTRTVVKGKPSKKLEKMYQAVFDAQEAAFRHIKQGAFADEVHGAVQEIFEKRGFKTGMINGRMQGFIHGTGHGVGLDIHELPRIGKTRTALQAGNVVTVEPGLYYYGIGGIRLEDMVVVRKNGCHNLTSFPKELVI